MSLFRFNRYSPFIIAALAAVISVVFSILGAPLWLAVSVGLILALVIEVWVRNVVKEPLIFSPVPAHASTVHASTAHQPVTTPYDAPVTSVIPPTYTPIEDVPADYDAVLDLSLDEESSVDLGNIGSGETKTVLIRFPQEWVADVVEDVSTTLEDAVEVYDAEDATEVVDEVTPPIQNGSPRDVTEAPPFA